MCDQKRKQSHVSFHFTQSLRTQICVYNVKSASSSVENAYLFVTFAKNFPSGFDIKQAYDDSCVLAFQIGYRSFRILKKALASGNGNTIFFSTSLQVI